MGFPGYGNKLKDMQYTVSKGVKATCQVLVLIVQKDLLEATTIKVTFFVIFYSAPLTLVSCTTRAMFSCMTGRRDRHKQKGHCQLHHHNYTAQLALCLAGYLPTWDPDEHQVWSKIGVS